MDKEQKIIYIQSQLLACQIEMQAMIAENQYRMMLGESIAYKDEAFLALFDKYPLSHNAVISELCCDT